MMFTIGDLYFFGIHHYIFYYKVFDNRVNTPFVK